MRSRPTPFSAPVNVARPLLPPLSEYATELEAVWESAWLTNNASKHIQLEEALSRVLGAPHLSLFNNGTMALIVALRALKVSGEVITTPFTFPATPHSLVWAGAMPVFADVNPETLTLDPEQIEKAITPQTRAILAVHVYGMPCDVRGIQKIADRHGLKVIYDAAHAFGADIDGAPVAAFGDATMFSFHATKLFHTAEGGALAMVDAVGKDRAYLLKNFGIRNEVDVLLPGLNAKMNEIQAALGLVVLRYWEAERAARLAIGEIFRRRLNGISGVRSFDLPANVRNSGQYFIIRVNSSAARLDRDALYEALKPFNIFSRRYFYPLCSDYAFYRDLPGADPKNLPAAQKAASEVLALPYFGALGADGAEKVCDVIQYLMANA